MSRVGVKRRLDLPLTFSERLLNLFWMLMMLHQNNLKKGQILFGFNLEYNHEFSRTFVRFFNVRKIRSVKINMRH